MSNLAVERVRDAARREQGQAMAEYAAILALIAAISIAVLTTLGGQILSLIQSVVNGL